MTEKHVIIDIAAPPRRVWDVMSDVERWHEWNESVQSIRRIDPGPLRPGQRIHIKQRKFPPAVWTMVDLKPGRSFTWRSGLPGYRVTGKHVIQPADEGSRVTLMLVYEGIFGGALARLTRDITERYLNMEATGLKQRSESAAT